MAPSDAGDAILPRRYDLYRARYTTDPAQLERELLLPNTPATYAFPTLENGHYVMTYFTPSKVPAADAIVVRVADGRAWRSDLPDDQSWGPQNYPTSDELWGAVAKNWTDLEMETFVRVPYSAMTTIQNGLPK